MFAKPDDNDDKAGCDNQMEALLLLSLSLSLSLRLNTCLKISFSLNFIDKTDQSTPRS